VCFSLVFTVLLDTYELAQKELEVERAGGVGVVSTCGSKSWYCRGVMKCELPVVQ
jgi:hypothetical protein